ncbi:hypothetical protein AALO_G00159890 [Alosa alosa]|uniref:Uncharacterized protein n=1 Tax=Alosa alosa TaxID=278164 RepID=A0AAV6GI00_9TELE|nr:hypothetical protein AALO_G00159890 [Alosa alosa]
MLYCVRTRLSSNMVHLGCSGLRWVEPPRVFRLLAMRAPQGSVVCGGALCHAGMPLCDAIFTQTWAVARASRLWMGPDYQSPPLANHLPLRTGPAT